MDKYGAVTGKYCTRKREAEGGVTLYFTSLLERTAVLLQRIGGLSDGGGAGVLLTSPD
ncbi:hypothetical protein ACZ87_01211 [Candidatus Erwinia dacicola]|uniref:Uncharacterized protein n=1 Tax=Candidatus Erwinia dacicola TaxID=252393 RepID=A0A328TT12_9GAMM|nr:hypothetical protein ACZ87_01211 [Candidatus Erwinia dacicola]